ELARMAQTALQGHGAALGVAEDAASLVMFSQACDGRGVSALLRQCADGRVTRDGRVDVMHRDRTHVALAAHGIAALVAAPAAWDLACARAHATPEGIGIAVVGRATDAWLAEELALKSAERNCIGLVMWRSDASS